MSGQEQVTYRSVLANREFAAILVSQGLSILGDQVARIAVALLLFQRTHSALAASASFAVSYGTYLVGGPVLASLSDRYSRRTIMIVSDLGRFGAVLLLVFSTQLPLVVIFALLVLVAAFAPTFDSARAATLPEVLSEQAYPKGNGLCFVVFQAAGVLGFVLGGALVATTSVRQALLLDASTFLVSAGAVLGLLKSRSVTSQPAATNLLRDTAEGARIVYSDPRLRRLLAFALLGAAAVAAPESLAVPLSAGLGGGGLAAGALAATIPAGFILASLVVLRLPGERREASLSPLLALTLVPLLATPLVPHLTGVAVLWTISGCGSSLQLIASSAYVAAAPAHARARAYGLASSGLMAAQGLAQLAAGLVATQGTAKSGSAWAIAAMSLLLLGLMPLLARSVRSAGSAAQEISVSVR